MRNIIFLFCLILLSTSVNSQSVKDKLIKQKSKELGLSEDELLKKASDMGYDVKGSSSTSLKNIVPPVVIKQKTSIPVKADSNATVPQFEERSELNAFGYNIFNYKPETFEPGLNVPVPQNYIIGPGDELIISLWGETQFVEKFIVSKEGTIYLENGGLVNINGLNLDEVKEKLFHVLSKKYSTLASQVADNKTYMEVATGELKTVKVFCLGEVVQPGGYNLPSLATIFTALYYCGGPKISGTLRNIKVVREGKEIAKIDIYEYLLSGKKDNDISLHDGDVIYVERVGKRVALEGNIFKPAIYELLSDDDLASLLKYSGGLNFNTFTKRVAVERIIPFSERDKYEKNIINIDLDFSSKDELINSSFKLEDGDLVSVSSISNEYENLVSVGGEVNQPGNYELKKYMKVSDLIEKADSLTKYALFETATITRTVANNKKEIITFNLKKALEHDPLNDLTLVNEDSLAVYRYDTFFPIRSIRIEGEVNEPGIYARSENMTLKDVITLAGGLTYFASKDEVEISSLDTTLVNSYYISKIINLKEDFLNDSFIDSVYLHDYDIVSVKKDPKKKNSDVIYISGEVKYPGNYSILDEGERFADIIRRAGGLLTTAYEKGIHIIRKNKYDTGIEAQGMKLRADTLGFTQGGSFALTYYDKKFLSQFSNIIPIEWSEMENNPNSPYNFKLMPGDSIVIPEDEGIVFVSGEVGIESMIFYKSSEDLDYYIEQAGGFTKNSGEDRVIVMQPNGRKWDGDDEIYSGARIYVPTEIEVEDPRTIWEYIRDITSIISSAAVLVITIQNINR